MQHTHPDRGSTLGPGVATALVVLLALSASAQAALPTCIAADLPAPGRMRAVAEVVAAAARSAARSLVRPDHAFDREPFVETAGPAVILERPTVGTTDALGPIPAPCDLRLLDLPPPPR